MHGVSSRASCHLTVFSDEVSVQTFGLVSNWVFCFLVVEILKNYILDISALSDMCFTIIVSYSVIGIFALLNLFFFFYRVKLLF